MSDRSIALCERIRQHCRERNWYGPDLLSSTYELCCYYDANGRWHEGEIPASGHDEQTPAHMFLKRSNGYSRIVEFYLIFARKLS